MHRHNTPPQSDVPMSIVSQAEAVVLHQQEGLGQDICGHVVSTNEQKFDQTISDAFTNEVIPNVNMFCCRVVD